ncbi:MAG: xanthine dehydrogenase accessory protein XdhC [Pseudomonadota bacterium]
MSFDRDRLAALVAEHGSVVRVVVADVAGSVPRGPGASFCLWDGGMEGTIGGGSLEWEAMARAREVLASGRAEVLRLPLGPGLGQCCGGHVTLALELWEAVPKDEVVARPMPGASGEMPLGVKRVLAAARRGVVPVPGVVDGWLVEPVSRATRDVWIYGAGHVGRALAGVLAPLPEVAVTLVDDAWERLPDPLPDVAPFIAKNPADAVAHAPDGAEHFVLTYSHAIDLEVCHRVLQRPFRSLGLIGSATKFARFRSRLTDLGHSAEQIARIRCPIGDPALGKHPQAIAVGVAAELLRPAEARQKEARA